MGLLCFVLGRDRPEAEFLDEIQTKVLRVFLLAIQSHLYSFVLRFLFLQTHANSYSFYSTLYTLYGLRNTYRNIQSETSHDDAQKPQRNCRFMNLLVGTRIRCKLANTINCVTT
jgi:hypothetical protein